MTEAKIISDEICTKCGALKVVKLHKNGRIEGKYWLPRSYKKCKHIWKANK